MWNFFGDNYPKGWHSIEDVNPEEHYYFVSFVYRLIVVFAWIRKIEKEMVYLDTTFSQEEDLDFIKFLRLLPQILYDAELFKGHEYERGYASDHFFRGQLESLAESLITVDGVCDFSSFRNHYREYSDAMQPVCRFICGISPDEERLRWDRLQILHISIMALLNSFGYDFQYTAIDKLSLISSKPRKTRLLKNFSEMVYRIKLENQVELKRILKSLD